MRKLIIIMIGVILLSCNSQRHTHQILSQRTQVSEINNIDARIDAIDSIMRTISARADSMVVSVIDSTIIYNVSVYGIDYTSGSTQTTKKKETILSKDSIANTETKKNDILRENQLSVESPINLTYIIISAIIALTIVLSVVLAIYLNKK